MMPAFSRPMIERESVPSRRSNLAHFADPSSYETRVAHLGIALTHKCFSIATNIADVLFPARVSSPNEGLRSTFRKLKHGVEDHIPVAVIHPRKIYEATDALVIRNVLSVNHA